MCGSALHRQHGAEHIGLHGFALTGRQASKAPVQPAGECGAQAVGHGQGGACLLAPLGMQFGVGDAVHDGGVIQAEEAGYLCAGEAGLMQRPEGAMPGRDVVRLTAACRDRTRRHVEAPFDVRNERIVALVVGV
jgi:hypothetical protein